MTALTAIEMAQDNDDEYDSADGDDDGHNNDDSEDNCKSGFATAISLKKRLIHISNK